MQCVVRFDDIFAAIVETAVPQDKPEAAKSEILLVVARDSVGHEGEAGAIEPSAPAHSTGPEAEQDGFVRLGVGVRFLAALVPAPAAEDTQPVVEGLLEVCAETVLDRGLQRMGGDVRGRRQAGAEIVDGLAIAAHVGVINVGEEAQDAFPLWNHGAVNLELHVLGVRAAEISIEMDAVGDLRHQSFGETRGPASIVILKHSGICETARVSGVVVCAAVVDGPVQKLEI